MNPIKLPFSEEYADVCIKGEIFASQNPIVLSHDLLEVSLPSGKSIDVGWYPEHDPTGKYRVLLYRDQTGYSLREFFTTDPFEAVEKVHEWIESDRAESGYLSVSSSDHTTLDPIDLTDNHQNA